MIPTLTTDRLTLRAPDHRDIAPITEFYGSHRSQFVGGPKSTENAWRHLALEIGHWTLAGYGRWAVDDTATGTPVGLVGLWNPAGWPEPEIGWDLWDGHTGKGYATEAALAARSYAYDTLGWTTAISLVAPGNSGSARVAARLGARHDGDVTHPALGHLHIWRHPAPGDSA